MKKKLSKGNTLLAKGPIRIEAIKGKLEVFGSILQKDDELIISEGHGLPLFAIEDSELDLYLSNEAQQLSFIEENSIPKKWEEIKDNLIKEINENKGKKPLKIMVLGISCGKTSLVKYLLNNFTRNNLKGIFIDTDLGQQHLHIPTLIASSIVINPIIDISDLGVEKKRFIGATYPKGNNKFILSKYVSELIEEYETQSKDLDYICMDTDGWLLTEVGVSYKTYFINKVDPDILIIFHDEEHEEYKKIEESAKERKDRSMILIDEKNKYYMDRSKEARRFQRQKLFSSVFSEYKKTTIPLYNMRFVKQDYDHENDKIIEVELDVEDLIELPYHYVIIALLDENSEIINIALLFTINIEKDYILLYTDINYKQELQIKKILMGSARLSTKGNTQGFLFL